MTKHQQHLTEAVHVALDELERGMDLPACVLRQMDDMDFLVMWHECHRVDALREPEDYLSMLAGQASFRIGWHSDLPVRDWPI